MTTTRTAEQPTLGIGTGSEPVREVRETIYVPCWHCGRQVPVPADRCGWCGARDPARAPSTIGANGGASDDC